MFNEYPDVMTVAQMANALGIGLNSAYRLVNQRQIDNITADGKVWRVSGESSTVNPSAIPSDLSGSYSYHNHPAEKTNYSFSASDVAFFIKSGEVYSKASDDIYEYTMRRTDETVEMSPDDVYHRFKEIESKNVYEMMWDGKIAPDFDKYHEVMRILSRELRFEYKRKKRSQ